ncbi:hypothetical protein GYMLUDRAFT_263766 [Collybiopsis luxurians FD-317 M1]|uniref:FHA domain-containing protein n=1 Tax=Collybiopsis luxurians FD-317 M1 TaxID=944289 RepID=A0A0D0BMW6_9AGAR|nr:hypothetical protein GYMLUDRAFT_263766 [Collybiopsis luxurians FD-317 M1]
MTITLTLTPTQHSLSFTPKSISLRIGEPIVLGRQGIFEDSFKEESPNNGYFSTGFGCLNSVSREHALVWVDHEGKVFIQDLNSSNGTYINGVRLASQQPTPLKMDDVLRLGISLRVDQVDVEMTPVIARVAFGPQSNVGQTSLPNGQAE